MMLEAMTSAFSLLMEGILRSSEAIVQSLVFILAVSSKIGEWVVYCIQGAVNLVISLAVNTVILLQVLFEDFCYFLSDVIYLLSGIESSVQDLWNWFGTLFTGKSYTKQAVLETGRFFTQIIIFFKSFLILLKDSLILFGYLIWSIPVGLLTGILQLINLLLDFAKYTTSAFLDVPVESFLGLVIALCLIYFEAKFQHYKIILAKCRMIFKKFLHISLLAAQQLLTKASIAFYLLKNMRQRKLTQLLSKRNMTRIQDLVKTSPSKVDLITQLESEKQSKTCVICMDKPRSVIIIDCRHFCMCDSCAGSIYETTGECPICRVNISDFWFVYT